MGGNLADFHDRAFHLSQRGSHLLTNMLQQFLPVSGFGLFRLEQSFDLVAGYTSGD